MSNDTGVIDGKRESAVVTERSYRSGSSEPPGVRSTTRRVLDVAFSWYGASRNRWFARLGLTALVAVPAAGVAYVLWRMDSLAIAVWIALAVVLVGSAASSVLFLLPTAILIPLLWILVSCTAVWDVATNARCLWQRGNKVVWLILAVDLTAAVLGAWIYFSGNG